MQRKSQSLLDSIRWPRNLYTAQWPLVPLSVASSPDGPPSNLSQTAINQEIYFDPPASAASDPYPAKAALRLHPLLMRSAATIETLSRSLSNAMPYPAGASLLELGDDFAELHLLTSGTMKIVAVRGEGTANRKTEEVTRIHAGQWIGIPALLCAFERRTDWPSQEEIALYAIATEPITTRRIPRARALELMATHATFRAFVTHNVAVRWARRKEMLDCFATNAYLRFLPRSHREYLLQQGALRRTPKLNSAENAPLHYMESGKPAGRISLVLSGEASAYLRCTSRASSARPLFVGTFRPSDLIGHESLVGPKEAEEAPTQMTLAHPITEEDRETDVYLTQAGSGTELFEFEWHVVRWTLDSEPPIWNRIVQMMTGRVSRNALLPPIFSIYGAKPGLGTSMLGYGLAARLAEQEDPGQTSYRSVLLDLQGGQTFDKIFKALGFEVETKSDRPPLTRQHKHVDDASSPKICYEQLVPSTKVSGWPERLDVVWPANPGDEHEVVRLVALLRARPDVCAIVVAGSVAASHITPQEKPLFEAITGISDRVLVLDDDSIAPYPFGDAEPTNITYLHRMTPAYKEREQTRAKQVPYDWALGHWMRYLPSSVQSFIHEDLGYKPATRLEADQRLAERQVVRVPDDRIGFELYKQGNLLALLQRSDLPLSRAIARLHRVVEGRTVGLALGGGGAWGFAHVALIRNLEGSGVPIDYISGSSFGSVIGSIYAAGGHAALDKLVEENSEHSRELIARLQAALQSPLTRSIFLTMVHGVFLELFLHRFLQRALPKGTDIPTLGTTEIPFAPVASELTEPTERTDLRAPIGWGVRASGSLPPLFMPMARLSETLVDGGVIASVPANMLKQLGADFIIAANVVPSRLRGSTALLDMLPNTLLGRFGNLTRAFYVMGAQAGKDQAYRHAQHALHMESKDYELWETWRGNQIVEDTTTRYFQGPAEKEIAQKWQTFGTYAQRTAEKRMKQR